MSSFARLILLVALAAMTAVPALGFAPAAAVGGASLALVPALGFAPAAAVGGAGLALVPAVADLAPIQLDGYFDDWTPISILHDDRGDVFGTVDYGRIWAANDQDYLYLRFETEGEVQPDEQQNMMIYLDTDMNATTGTAPVWPPSRGTPAGAV